MYLRSLKKTKQQLLKKPVKETKTVEIPLTREEISIERRQSRDNEAKA